MIEAALDDSLKLMLDWAEEAGDIKVRQMRILQAKQKLLKISMHKVLGFAEQSTCFLSQIA